MQAKFITLAVVFVFAAMAAFAGQDTASEKPFLTRVEPAKVCMVNEQFMNRQQIPIEVNGKTYYGCCEMCKKALAEKAEKRFAIDPVSKKKIDKGDAVIGADENGNVFYFENEENLKKYKP